MSATTCSACSRDGNAVLMNQSWIWRSSRPDERDAERLVDRPARPADLLVVRDRRARHLEVDDEREVRLVVAHAERRGGDDALELVGLQLALDLDLGLGGLVAEVRARVDAVAAQPVGDPARVLDGERVDDAGARELRDRLGEPREPLRRAREMHDVEGEALAVERPAQHEQIVAELIDDVFDDAVVRGRGGAQHRHAGAGADRARR